MSTAHYRRRTARLESLVLARAASRPAAGGIDIGALARRFAAKALSGPAAFGAGKRLSQAVVGRSTERGTDDPAVRGMLDGFIQLIGGNDA